LDGDQINIEPKKFSPIIHDNDRSIEHLVLQGSFDIHAGSKVCCNPASDVWLSLYWKKATKICH